MLERFGQNDLLLNKVPLFNAEISFYYTWFQDHQIKGSCGQDLYRALSPTVKLWAYSNILGYSELYTAANQRPVLCSVQCCTTLIITTWRMFNILYWGYSELKMGRLGTLKTFKHTLGTLGRFMSTLATFRFWPHWDFGDIGEIGHIHQDIGHIQILATLGLWGHWAHWPHSSGHWAHSDFGHIGTLGTLGTLGRIMSTLGTFRFWPHQDS